MDKKDVESYLSAVSSMKAQAYLSVTMLLVAIADQIMPIDLGGLNQTHDGSRTLTTTE